MKKKLLSTALCAAAVLAVFGAASCSKTETKTSETSSQTEEKNDAGTKEAYLAAYKKTAEAAELKSVCTKSAGKEIYYVSSNKELKETYDTDGNLTNVSYAEAMDGGETKLDGKDYDSLLKSTNNSGKGKDIIIQGYRDAALGYLGYFSYDEDYLYSSLKYEGNGTYSFTGVSIFRLVDVSGELKIENGAITNFKVEGDREYVFSFEAMPSVHEHEHQYDDEHDKECNVEGCGYVRGVTKEEFDAAVKATMEADNYTILSSGIFGGSEFRWAGDRDLIVERNTDDEVTGYSCDIYGDDHSAYYMGTTIDTLTIYQIFPYLAEETKETKLASERSWRNAATYLDVLTDYDLYSAFTYEGEGKYTLKDYSLPVKTISISMTIKDGYVTAFDYKDADNDITSKFYDFGTTDVPELSAECPHVYDNAHDGTCNIDGCGYVRFVDVAGKTFTATTEYETSRELTASDNSLIANFLNYSFTFDSTGVTVRDMDGTESWTYTQAGNRIVAMNTAKTVFFTFELRADGIWLVSRHSDEDLTVKYHFTEQDGTDVSMNLRKFEFKGDFDNAFCADNDTVNYIAKNNTATVLFYKSGSNNLCSFTINDTTIICGSYIVSGNRIYVAASAGSTTYTMVFVYLNGKLYTQSVTVKTSDGTTAMIYSMTLEETEE